MVTPAYALSDGRPYYYTITVSPPYGANLSKTIYSGVSFSSIPPSQLRCCSVHLEWTGIGSIWEWNTRAVCRGLLVAGQSLHFSETDVTGRYALTVAPGNYSVRVSRNGWNLPNVNAPQSYVIMTSQPVLIEQSTTLDLTLPVKKSQCMFRTRLAIRCGCQVRNRWSWQ